MTPDRIESYRGHDIHTPRGFMSIREYGQYRDEVMAKADALIQAYNEDRLTGQQKADIADIVSDLRNILDIQLDPEGPIRRRDLIDGNYSNVVKDRILRYQLRILRNADISLHGTWGTQWLQKFGRFLYEDIPNYVGIEYRRLSDHLRQYTKIAGAVGAGVAGGVGGYALAGIPGAVAGASAGAAGGYLALDWWFQRSRRSQLEAMERRERGGPAPQLAAA